MTYTRPVPILMYHLIEEPRVGFAYPELFVRTDDFERQMRWLRRDGYEAVTLEQVEGAWYRHGRLPERPVVISFDDGYRSQYLNAFPVLHALGWPGVLSLRSSDAELADENVRELLESGWELGSHTISHPDLTQLDDAGLRRQVAGSRRDLARRFHVPVDNFCYPSGCYDERVVAAVKAAGYRGAITTDPGLAEPSEPYTLKRIRVSLSDGLDGMAEALQAAGADPVSAEGP